MDIKTKIWRRIRSLLVRFLIYTRLPNNVVTTNRLINEFISEQRTLVSRERLNSLARHCSSTSLPSGNLVECGIGNGGCVALMAYISSNRQVWGFDSFHPMPEQTEEDEEDGQESVGLKCFGRKGIQEVEYTLNRFLISKNNIKIISGWFEDTIEKFKIELTPIAILRLDNDWYKSTKYCLEALYDCVAIGGIIIIDDYHTFKGCRKAVDEFRISKGIMSPLITTEVGSEVYFVKDR